MSIRKRTWTTKKGERKEAWVVDYKDSQGRRAIKTFRRKKDADAWWEGKAAPEVRTGIHTAESRTLTFAETGERWIKACRAADDPPLEQATIAMYEQMVRLHITPFMGTLKLTELTQPRLQEFVDQLRDNGRSLSMRRRVVTSLKTLLSFAQARGYVVHNVAKDFRMKSRAAEREVRDIREEIPSKAELRTMMDKAPARWRALIVVAIFTGMRASEIRGLAWGHVDLDEGIIHVRQRADAWNTIGFPKSRAGTRDIPLAPMAVNALREWKLAYPRPIIGRDDKGKPIRQEHRPEHLVFANGVGRVDSHANIANRFFRPLQVDHGIIVNTGKKDEEGKPIMAPKWTLHSLRHAAASLFIEQGWPPKKVQTVMGHASLQMTFDLYGKLFRDEKSDKEAMERMQAALMAE